MKKYHILQYFSDNMLLDIPTCTFFFFKKLSIKFIEHINITYFYKIVSYLHNIIIIFYLINKVGTLKIMASIINSAI